MKKSILNPVKYVLLIASILLVQGFASATTYTAVVSGNWSDSLTWGGSVAPFNLSTTDVVIIGAGVTVTMDSNVTLNGLLAELNVSGTLSSATNSLTLISGSIIGSGVISVDKVVLDAAGTITYNGSITADTIMNAIASLGSAAQITVNKLLDLSGILILQTGGSLQMAANSTIDISGASIALSGGNLNLTSAYDVDYTTSATTAGMELSGSGLGKVKINVGTGNSVMLSSSLTTNDSLNFGSGTLMLNGNNLTINGKVGGNVMIDGNVSSNLAVNTSGGLSTALMFTTGGQDLNNVTINVGSGNSVMLSSALTIHSSLVLTGGSKLDISGQSLTLDGNLNGSGSLMVDSNSKLTINGSTSLTGDLSLTGTDLGKLTVSVGSGNKVTLATNLTVDSLNLSSGTLVLNSNNLTVNADIASGAGIVLSTPISSISVTSAAMVRGLLMFDATGDTVNNLTVNISGMGSLKIGSDAVIKGTLAFTNGFLDVNSNNLTIGASGSITGAGMTSYVITSGGGSLTMSNNTSITTTYQVGTLTNYLPAEITLNAGSNTGTIGLNVSSGVYSQGTTGVLISASQSMVDATWLFQNNIGSGLNANMKLSWETSAEVNGFIHTDDYISHFSASAWDDIGDSMTAALSGGLYSVTRANITSMSPFAVFDQSTVPTGINPIASNTEDFIIYPNPAYQDLNIKSSANAGETVYVDIYNALGQLVSHYQFNNATVTIPVYTLAEGTYLIKFYNDRMNVVKKFSKL